MVKTMNKDAIIFAMANPVPEIMPDVAKAAGARVVGIGRDLCGKSDMAEITSSAERLLKSVK